MGQSGLRIPHAHSRRPSRAQRSLGSSSAPCGAVWFVSAVQPFLHLTHYGVVPRTVGGREGVLFAPGLWRRPSGAEIRGR